ncbi:Alpha/beta hydrolase domain-containing protein 4 [Allomyces arbusculus]|nr:Alpha/beta hydrolase domain-containing protein 4 [Allomyces arbusculus]
MATSPATATASTTALHTSAAPQSPHTGAAAATATASASAPNSSVTAQLARKMRGTPRSSASSAASRADDAYRAAEAAMLAHMPSSVNWTLDRVAIPRAFWPSDSVLAKSKRCRRAKEGETYEINTLHVRLRGELEKKPPLVLVHGWGGALGMWVENVEELAREYDVYAVDLLGWGGSSRPNFAKSFPNTPEAAQAFFVESLDAWRTVMNLDKITLVGHSMGGFVAGSYLLRYPSHLRKLVLLSPIGLRGFPTIPTSTFTQSLQFAVIHRAWSMTPQRLLALLPKAQATAIASRVHARTTDIFPDPQLASAFSDYILAGAKRAPGMSGEAAFARLGSPFRGTGWRVPLDDELRRAVRESGVPVVLAYGAHDWIDPRYAVEKLAGGEGGGGAHVYLLKGAGHHGYAENACDFAKIVMRGEGGTSACGVREVAEDPAGVAALRDGWRGAAWSAA